MCVHAYMHIHVPVCACICILVHNIKNYNVLLVFLLLGGDSAKEAQTDQKAKKRHFVLLELRTLVRNWLSQRKRKMNCYFYSK